MRSRTQPEAPGGLKPHARRNAARRVLSQDHLWAARITKKILLDCHPWQQQAVIDPARRISMIVGRGGAKTTTMRARGLIKLLWLRNQRVGFAATSADHARELNWDKLIETLENYGIRTTGEDPDMTLLDSKMRLTCRRTGSVYRCRGIEDRKDAERFRGFPMAEFDADECGSWPPELFQYSLEKCVSPRLGEALTLPPGLLEFLLTWDPDDEDGLDDFLEPVVWEDCRGGVICVGSTPPEYLRGEFYDITREGGTRHRPYEKRKEPEFANWLGYSSHTWEMTQVYDLPNARKLYPALVYNWEEALREKAEKGWSDDHPTWMREYRGKWAADNTDTVFKYRPHLDGKEWNQWNPIGHVPKTLDDLRAVLKILTDRYGDVRHVVQLDEGFKDPFACNVYSFSPRDPERTIWHTFPFERTGMYARPIAELLLGTDEVQQMLATGRVSQKYGGIFGALGSWPDGVGMDGDDSTLAELEKVYGIRMVKSDRKPDAKLGRIELVNGDLVDGRIKILKDSPLEKQIAVLQWKDDDFGQKKEDKAQSNHSTDTLADGRKLIAHLFEGGLVVQDAKPQSTSYKDPQGLGTGIGPDVDTEIEQGLLSPAEWTDDEDW
jgi:hypothetical protein